MKNTIGNRLVLVFSYNCLCAVLSQSRKIRFGIGFGKHKGSWSKCKNGEEMFLNYHLSSVFSCFFILSEFLQQEIIIPVTSISQRGKV